MMKYYEWEIPENRNEQQKIETHQKDPQLSVLSDT